jgi:hypothetical protein
MSGPANLDQQLDAYLAIREAVGLRNKSQYRLLHDFVAYASFSSDCDPPRPRRCPRSLAPYS